MKREIALSSPRGDLVATLPRQPPQRSGAVARRVGAGVLCAGLAGFAAIAIYRLVERLTRQPQAKPTSDEAADEIEAARCLHGGAAVLSFSVLADSAVEHYRGAFHNPAMYLPPAVAAVSVAGNLRMMLGPKESGVGQTLLSGLTLATGIGGFAFHLYNVAKREGGFDLANLFYGAPLGAPFALSLAALAGLAGQHLVRDAEEGQPATLVGLPAGPLLAFGTAGGLVGTVAEAALLHFRGAFHDPFMFVPVTLPPAAAAALIAAVLCPGLRVWARRLLQATAAAGVAGVGFHIYGLQRNMGGFRNWSQNLLNGPPIPAPPSFSGVALAGLAALRLLESA